MAKASKKKLDAFEGDDVIGTAIKITKTGDGLSKAMSIDNEELHIGDVVHVVLECEVASVGFDKIKDADGLVRAQKLVAGRATIVDGNLVADALDAQSKRLEEAAGIKRLFDKDGEPIAEPKPDAKS